jgi:glycerol-3-phosphate dehydrogenase
VWHELRPLSVQSTRSLSVPAMPSFFRLSSRRLVRPLLYSTATAAVGGGALYYHYRPRNIPGSGPADVPLNFAADGTIAPPRFPKAKSRAEQIADLKRSGAQRQASTEKSRGLISWLGGGAEGDAQIDDGEPYDLLIIGAGATGSGIALDAATRGLKVAVVERDDFSSGTSSKSTKLVHGGVRYLEKAVWELDYNQ